MEPIKESLMWMLKKYIKKIEMQEIKRYPVVFRRHWLTKKWRWRITADNGRIISASTQSYWNLQDCTYNAKSSGKSLSEGEYMYSYAGVKYSE